MLSKLFYRDPYDLKCCTSKLIENLGMRSIGWDRMGSDRMTKIQCYGHLQLAASMNLIVQT